MIELYTWKTPNGYKPILLLEELEWPYVVRPVDLGKGEQHAEAFLRVNPNGKIPALTHSRADGTVLRVFESGAILIYLAETAGRFLPARGAERYETLQWLMFQMAGVGPMMGQAVHFLHHAPDDQAYAVARYVGEARRLLEVLDRRLEQVAFLAGSYSIADMATHPWLRRVPGHIGIESTEYPNVQRWLNAVEARPAVQRAYAVDPRQARGPVQGREEAGNAAPPGSRE